MSSRAPSRRRFAERLVWPLGSVLTVAEWCRDRELIDTDAGMGDPIRIIEGRYRP